MQRLHCCLVLNQVQLLQDDLDKCRCKSYFFSVRAAHNVALRHSRVNQRHSKVIQEGTLALPSSITMAM